MAKRFFPKGSFWAILFLVGTTSTQSAGLKTRIDLTDPASIKKHQPVLLAHWSWVVTPEAPDNSLKAVKLAAERGYAMVEVDIRESKDHIPYAFHDDTLMEACGVESRIEDMTSKEIDAVYDRFFDIPTRKD
ncbi:hypothetical protein GF373_13945 [bacterium]|nr:hypothetical protein [bacterium]